MDYTVIKNQLHKIKLNKPKILVLGDIMLDEYVVGKVKRISPEAPVPILDFQSKGIVLGGAGNVAHNLINLGAEVTVGTIVGDDIDGQSIIDLLLSLEISSELISVSSSINTTKKTRFTDQGTHLLRLDNDSKGFLDTDFDFFKKRIIEKINNFDCIIISDYNKGICEESIIQEIINKANKRNIPIYIDPKGSQWQKYLNATCLTPNTKEVEEQLNLNLKNDSDFVNAAKIIKEKFKLNFCLITRGADGMTYLEKNKTIHQKVGKKEVFDVSGAGDTVIACLAASISSGVRIEDSIAISSNISSEVVTHLGTIPFDINMLPLND